MDAMDAVISDNQGQATEEEIIDLFMDLLPMLNHYEEMSSLSDKILREFAIELYQDYI